MDLQNLKLSRLMFLVENGTRDSLENIYFSCFKEYPLDNLTIEDLQFNIVSFLNNASIDEISKVFKDTF
jgi:hypothetical protein